MTWARYSGRALLAIAVVGIAYWATANKLLTLPAHEFWMGILAYLVAAEVVWTLAERKSHEIETLLPRRGVARLTRWDRRSAVNPRWFYDGGRVRMSDIVARADSHREALLGLQAAVMARVSGLRLHLLAAAPGSGRSTLLYRLGRALQQAGQQVFVVLPTPELLALDKILEVARRQQVYVLIDDLDMRPEAEEWLYELERFGIPLVVVAVTGPIAPDTARRDGLDAAPPADLMGRAVVHDVSVLHNDVVTLSRHLGSQVRLERVGLSLQEVNNLLHTSRALQGLPAENDLWSDLDRGPTLPRDGKLMIALCGAAEMAFTKPLWAKLFGSKTRSKWQKARLAVADGCLMLPPHRLTCLDFLTQMMDRGEPVAAALNDLCRAALAVAPAFAARLLFALAQLPPTRDLARAQTQSLQLPYPPASWAEAPKRLWRQALDACDLLAAEATATTQYPPELSRLTHSAFGRRDYQQALELSRRLLRNPVYRNPGHFNAALALAQLGHLSEATQELNEVKGGVPGTRYLRGVLAELSGDVLHALDEYEASRKANELPLSSTRRLAFAYLKSGAPRAAIPLFEAALSYQPQDADLYAGLAVAHLHGGMAQRAASQSSRAIQAGVDPLRARKAVAKACAQVHAYDRAATELEGCLSYDESDLEVWDCLGEACHWLGRFARQEECLRRLRSVQPESRELLLQMARCQRDQGRPQEAQVLLERLLTDETPDLQAVLLAAEVAGTCDDSQQQEALARRALAQGDNSGWGHYWLADSQPELNQEARAAYQQAIQLLTKRIRDGLTPRHTATAWQGIYLAALKLEDQELASQAARKAAQEDAICEALHAEINSVAHHRTVPADMFLESLTPYKVLATPPPADVSPAKPTTKPVTAPSESSILRNRQTGRPHGSA